MLIAYLNAADIDNLDFDIRKLGNREKAILEHPNKTILTIEEFIAEFNDDLINDQGYLAIVKE